MALKILKDIIKYLTYRIKYLGSNIVFTARVSANSSLNKNIVIGKRSIIDRSNLNEDVKISEHCNIVRSELGKNVKINKYTVVLDSRLAEKTIVYENCHLSKANIDRFSYIAAGSKLNLAEIGKFCSIGPELICGYGDHPTDFISTSPIFFSTLKQCGVSFSKCDRFEERKKIIIGNDVWIGTRVFIKDGVKIGHGAIVGAGAVVVKDVPDYAIVGGVPAKIIRFRFTKDIIQQLLKIQWWNWSEEKLRKGQFYFATKNIKSFIEWAQMEIDSNLIQKEINTLTT